MANQIFFTINNLDTAGMKYVLADIAFGLNPIDFTPIIIVNKISGSVLEKKLQEKFEVREMMLRNPGGLNFLPNLIKNIRYLRKHKGVSHSFDYSSDWNEALTMFFAGLPHVVEKTNLSFKSRRWKIKLGLATHIVCLSRAQAALMKSYQRKLTIIPTGIDLQHFMHAQPVDRIKLGLKADDVMFVYVGNLVKVKGHEELIHAMALVKDEFPKLKIVCIGKGDPDFENHLKTLTLGLNVQDNIIFAGSSDNVAGFMHTADVKILATQNRPGEAFGAVIVEAMAAGLPVLSTRSGGPEDIIKDGETGLLVNADGVESLAHGLRKMMELKDSWKLMGDNGRKRAIELYNKEKMVKAYSEIYVKLL